jgi:hypothetical protein
MLTSTWLPLRGNANVVGKFHTFTRTSIALNSARAKSAVLVGSDGGLFVSTDGGATWDDRKNIGLTTT